MNTKTLTAGAALTRGQLVVAAATATAAATDSAYGVVQDGAASGNPVPVCVFGKTRALAASAISVGDKLMPAAGGKVQTFDSADGSTLAGWALEAATADGDLVEIIFLGAADFSDSVTQAAVTAVLTAANIATLNTAGALREFSTITVGAEGTNTITIDLAQNVAAADKWIVRCLTAMDTLATTASAFAITETGAGALSASHATLEAHLLTLSAAGAAQLTVTDVGGASSATVYVHLEPVEAAQGGLAGCSYLIPVTFDGV